MGSTLAIDWKTRRVRALLTTDTGAAQRRDRDESLLRLHAERRLRMGEDAMGPDGRELPTAVLGEVSGDLLQENGAAAQAQ